MSPRSYVRSWQQITSITTILYGYISVRNPDNASTFFLAKSLAPALISPAEDINELNIVDASQINSTRPRSFVERFIHSEILKRFENFNCVVHSYSPQVFPYTITDVPFKAVYHMPGFLGNQGVPNFDIAQFYGSSNRQDLLVIDTMPGAALARTYNVNSITTSFPAPSIVLMHDHSFAAAAESIEQAVFFAIYAQRSAEA